MLVPVKNETAGARGVGEGDALTDGCGEDRRIVIGQRLGCLTGDNRARIAPVEHETRNELWAEDARLADQLEHLA
ncbi:hypothetical protein SAMN05444581_11593 [Methylocapsa palsarum]|uniref:Uncharacterized protein n=1 Tax=Methylocapsa palsarum TaxID=1612308 RepID=A0A1I4BLH2_9HYPH|nr:hypothetical protein SAMN05444581_11593 [Methylocapsa palsarum]